MKTNELKWAALATGVIAATACGQTAQAPSSDALLKKLMEKGILTTKEAEDLRQEAERGFAKSYQAKTGLPDWVTSLKFSGDFRTRYEGFYSANPTAVDRHRFQYRLRLGLTAVMRDRLELGLRLASAGDTPGNPISSNQTLDNNASKKGLALDLVYGKWAPFKNDHWAASLTAGKMLNPFAFAPIVFDPDYTPEGLAEQFAYHLNSRHDLKLNLGQFVLEERSASSRDSYLVGAQLLWDAAWSPQWNTSLGIGGLAIGGVANLTTGNGQLNIGEGNTRVGGLAANPPLFNFNPIVVSGSIGYHAEKFPLYPGKFPITLAAEYLHNPAAPANNEGYSVKLTLGKSGKKRQWDFSYEFRELQADAIYEEFPESDFNAFTQTPTTTGGTGLFVNGTNIRGHIFKLGYSPYDALTLAVTYWVTENINPNPPGSISSAGRLQVDAVWRF
jgi:hypothetical protein